MFEMGIFFLFANKSNPRRDERVVVVRTRKNGWKIRRPDPFRLLMESRGFKRDQRAGRMLEVGCLVVLHSARGSRLIPPR